MITKQQDKELRKEFDKRIGLLPTLRARSKTELVFKVMCLNAEIKTQEKIINNFININIRLDKELKVLKKQLKGKKLIKENL